MPNCVILYKNAHNNANIKTPLIQDSKYHLFSATKQVDHQKE